MPYCIAFVHAWYVTRFYVDASRFKFQGDNYPFGVPRKEVIKKLRLSKSFEVFGKALTYVEYVENTSNIDVYSYNEIGFGFLFGQ